MGNDRQLRMIDSDERWTILNDKQWWMTYNGEWQIMGEMICSGEWQTFGTIGQWEITDNSECHTMGVYHMIDEERQC